MPPLLTSLLAAVQVAVVLIALLTDPTKEATERLQSWIMVGLSGSLVVVVGYFLKNLHSDFKQLVNAVQHIEKTVVEHGTTLKHHHELLEKIDRERNA